MMKKLIKATPWILFAAALAAGLIQTASAEDETAPAAKDEAAPAKGQAAPAEDQEGMLSILDEAPEVYWDIKRVLKFYSDRNMDRSTLDGPIIDRQYLFGSVAGLRDKAAENGFVIDAGLTQVLLGTVSGNTCVRPA